MFLYEEGQLAVEISHAMSFSFLWKQMGCFQLLVVLIKKVFRYDKTQNSQKNVFRKIFPREIFTERTLRDSLKHFFFAKGQGNTIKDLQGKLKCQAFPEILTLHFLNLPDIFGSAQLSAILGTAHILQKVLCL